MNRLPISKAAAGLLRELLNRAGTERDRILLTEIQSTDWQSLTFIGERHRIRLSIAGPRESGLAERITAGLDDVEFEIPGQIVADIAIVNSAAGFDGSVELTIEALTVAE